MQVLRRLFNKTTIHFLNQDANDVALQHQLKSLDTIFDLKAPIISTCDQSEIFFIESNQRRYFIKRYFRTKGLLSWLGYSRFRIEVRNQRWFNRSKLPSARVVAYGEEQLLFKTKRAVLITEGVPNTRDLAHIAEHDARKFKNPHWRESLISQSASIMRFFHQHSFCHNDLHWRNLLVQEPGTDSALQLYLIDCPSGRHLFWPLLHYKKLKDLANIDKYAPEYLSQTQRLRFFMTYRQIKKLGQSDKQMMKDILQHETNRVKRKSTEN